LPVFGSIAGSTAMFAGVRAARCTKLAQEKHYTVMKTIP
jgi:hypothetical protein